MLTRSLARRAGALLVVALAATACSSGGSVKNGNAADGSGWSATELAAARAVAHRISTAFPGSCTNAKSPTRSAYIDSTRKVGGPYPDGVVECDALNEQLEISSFTDAAARERFVTTRVSRLCHLSGEKNVGLPGIYWATGPTWSVQPDSEGVARRVAKSLGGQYLPVGCNGKNPGWTDADVALLGRTAAKIEKANDGCSDFQAQDRDLVSHTPPFDKIGTPAAVGGCTLANKATIILAAYASPKGSKTDTLLHAELKRECRGSKTTRIVRAGNVAVFSSTPEAATKVADEIGGTMTRDVCANA